MIIEKITDINWTWFVLHFVYEDANILQVLFNSVGNSSLLEVGDNLHAYLFILSSFPFLQSFQFLHITRSTKMRDQMAIRKVQ